MDVSANRKYARALALGCGGALLFALPLLMTMEMWRLGYAIERPRLLLLFLVSLPMLLGLSYLAGFEPTFHWKDEVLDALAALAIGMLLAVVILSLLGTLRLDHGLSETTGKVILCGIPGAMGALLAGKQFGAKHMEEGQPKAGNSYLLELFTMSVGALFFAFNIAPTDEVPVMANQMGPWRNIMLVLASIGLLHVIVYELGFPGEDLRKSSGGFTRTFLVFSVPGYGVSLLISLYILWTFGRLDGASVYQGASMVIALGFPAALGCATARLVI